MTPDTKAEGFVAGTRKIVQILRYGPRELALALLGLLLLAAIPLLPTLSEWLPIVAPALPWMTGVLAVLGLLLLGFSIRRIWKKAVAPLPEGKPKPAAIKGPAPFGPQDAELFARLGRNDDLNKLRDWILDDQKPLVALMGESGVGKTSLLRAGLAHHLQDDKIPVLYWEALPTEPEAKLLHAVRVGWEDEAKAPKTFEELASSVASGRRVVVIDQAEQLSPEGHPRIFELLRQVAEGDPPYRATWVVAFRREYAATWLDFELSLPEAVRHRIETLPLQRFFPKTAEKVIAALAEEGSLPVDQKLVEELVEGVAVEGKVSPADIGISLLVLSELAGTRPDGSLSLDDFRESGGQAGLLTRYLEKLLELFPEAERPEVLRGLLALVDLEKDQRLAEGRTLAEVEEAVKPASPPRFTAALRFLASGKARVLEELAGEPVRYRLVHERLIPAIRKLTGVILAEAERAGLALERGYRVWAQDRQARFLLHRKDLEEVHRFKDQIRWGKEELVKREFLRLSRRRETWRRVTLVVSLLVGFSIVIGIGEFARKREYQSLLATWGLPPDLYDRLGQLEELTLPGTVTRLDWLSGAKRLRKLTIENGLLESLEGLPAGLETLRVGESRLSDLSGMPPALTSLKLGSSRIERVASLPSGLRSLDLYFPTDPVMDFLPRSLESLRLEISENFLPLDFRRFKRLRSLTIHSRSGVERLSFRARLPAGLRSLELEGLDLQYSLAGLPMTIESLKLKSYGSNNSVNRIDVSHLRSLRSLTLDGGPVSLRLNTELLALMVDSSAIALEQLPESLRELEIRGRVVNEKELLVDNLEASRISDLRLPSGIESLALARLPPSLPKSLKRLKTSDPSHFPLPEGLESLHVEGEIDVPRLSRLPRSLKRLKVTELYNVPLPAGLKSLDLSRLLRPSGSNLPRLPDDLAELNLRGTDVRRLPSNLRRLTYLDISSTAIDSLKDLPRRLVYLDISSTPIDSLKGVPPSLKSLSLTIRQVKTLKGLPRSVTALHFHDDSVRLM